MLHRAAIRCSAAPTRHGVTPEWSASYGSVPAAPVTSRPMTYTAGIVNYSVPAAGSDRIPITTGYRYLLSTPFAGLRPTVWWWF